MANFDYGFWNLHPKLNCLISHICESQRLNYEDFEHNAYEDGALLNVTYKHKQIS